MNELSSPAPPTSRERRGGELVVVLDYRRIRVALWAGTLVVVALGVFRQAWFYLYQSEPFGGPLINLDSENSLPEWWSVLQLLLAAGLVLLNGFAESNRRWKPYWFVLAAIFVFLSMDEAVGVHEFTMGLLAPYHFTDFLGFSWIVPYAIACFVIGLIYLPFVAALPPPFRWRVILAGALFLASAMGDESIAAHCVSIGNMTCYQLEVIAEEGGEIIAITIFILTLLTLLGSRCDTVAVKIRNASGFSQIAVPAPSHVDGVSNPQTPLLTAKRSWVRVYVAIALATFVFQTWVRIPQCAGIENCTPSIAKGAAWAGIWPASWVVYLAGLSPINRLF